MSTGCGGAGDVHKPAIGRSFSRAPHRSSRGVHSVPNCAMPPALRRTVDMKTLTEFSGTLVRMAAKAVAEARKQLPKDAFPMRVPPAQAEPQPDAEPHDNKN